MQLGHVHIKTREDPQKVAKFYIDNFGATVKREIPGRGCQLDLHGVQLNVTTIIADQNHEQHVGIEHIAIETDDYAGALANFKKNGAQILEERVNNGRHVCWVAAGRRTDGADREGLSTAPPRQLYPHQRGIDSVGEESFRRDCGGDG
jgi:predicted enzyme related to lactoylglutathione lyase